MRMPRLLLVAAALIVSLVRLAAQPTHPTTTTISNVSPSPVQRGQNVTITATVTTGVGTPTGVVTFLSGAKPIGSGVLSGGTATLVTNQLPSGTNLLQASYVGDGTHINSTTATRTSLIVNSIAVGGNLFQSTTLTGLNDFFYITVADMNGDGNADLVAANINSHGVTIALGNGDGTFQSPVFIATGSGTSSPRAVTVADFNLDGIPDIAVTNGGDGTISILLGNGNGTSFTASGQTPITIAGGDIIHDIVASDFNQDGKPDLVVADESGNQIAVLVGNGNGVFQAPIFFTNIAGAFSLAAGDFNNDGKIDVAVSSPGSTGQISIFLNNGTAGIFTAGTPITNIDVGGYIAAGDFNGDGNLDLAAGNSGQTHIFGYVGNGSGGFTATAGAAATIAALAPGDFNADGILDVAVTANSVSSGTAEVHYGDANGNFGTGATVGSVPVNPQGVAVGDFNNDGHDDFVIGELGATPATFFLGVGAPATVTANAGSGQSTTVNTAFGTPLQALVKDSTGNLLSGINTSFTAPASGASGLFASGSNGTASNTNASGVATASVFTANTTAGTYTISAAAGTVTNATAFSLTNNPGGPASVSPTAGTPQSVTIQTAFPTALRATVQDSFGNPTPGINVTFTAPAAGASGTFAATGTRTTTVATNAAGVAIASTFTANNRAGSYNVNATVAGVGSPAVFALTNSPGGPSSVSATAGSGQNAPVGTNFATALQATVTDSAGNLLQGITVTFTAPAAGPSGKFGALTATNAVTNVSGVATAPTFTANTQAGTYVVNATVVGVANPAAFTLTNMAGAPALIAAGAGNEQSTGLGQAFGTAMQAAVVDNLGNGVAGIVVTFTAPGSGATGTFPSGTTAMATTNAVGVATAPTFTANGTAGAFAVTATAPGVPGSAMFQLANNPGNSSVSLNASSNPANLSQPVTLTATVTPSTATGQVTFLYGTQVVGTTTLNSSGQASLTTSSLGPRTDFLEAEYSGDSQFATAVSPRVPLTVSAGMTFPFEPATGSPFPTGGAPGAVASGDFNGDGVPDLAIVAGGANTVHVLLGNGSGGFQAPVIYNVHVGPMAVAAGDLNGDGNVDLIVGNAGSSDVSVLLGNGNGTFQTAVNYPAGGSVTGLAISDVDGDSKPDAVLSLTSGSYSILFGNGDGTLGGPRPNFSGAYQLQNWSAISSNGGTTSITPASGPASKASFAYSINLGNPGGGVSARTWTFQNTAPGTGTVSFNWTYTGFHAFFAVTALFQVFAGGPSGNNIVTLYNPAQQNCCTSPSAGFTASGTATINVNQGFPFGFIVGGSNFDSNSQLNGTLTITNFSAPAPPNPAPIMGAGSLSALATADFRGFGSMDLAITDATNSNVNVLFGNGDGTFGFSSPVPVGSLPQSLAIGDFNGDGLPDIAVANFGSNNVSILLNGSEVGFQSTSTYPVGTQPFSITVTDVNGDGILDLVTANSGSNDVSVLLGNGDGTFQAAITYPAGQSPIGIVSTDFNRDGHADLAISNNVSNNLTVLLGVGPPASVTATSGTPQSAAVNTAFPSPLQVVVRDANGLLVTGASVIFAAPTSGASATFAAGGNTATVQTNSSGIAVSPALTANNIAGTYNVTAQSNMVSASFSLANFGGPVTAAPASATFNLILPATTLPASQPIALTGTGAVPFTISTSTNSGGNWLAASVTQNATPATLTVSLTSVALHLAPGVYTGTITVDSKTNQTVVPITLNVLVPLSVPPALNVRYVIGGAALKQQILSITSGNIPIPFTVSSSAPWVTLSPTSGQTPGQVAVTIDPTQFQTGLYSATITITSPFASNGPVAVAVNLTVVAQLLAPANVTLTAIVGQGPVSLQVTVGGRTGDAFNVTVSDPFLMVSPSSGTVPTPITITADPSKLAPGDYPATIQLIPNTDQVLGSTINVLFQVRTTLAVSPDSYSPNSYIGIPSMPSQILTITTGVPIKYSVSASGATFFSATPTGGTTPGSVDIVVNTTGLSTGVYAGSVTISSLQTIPPSITIPVTLTIPPPGAPTGLNGDINVSAPPTGEIITETFTLVSDNQVPIPFQISYAGLTPISGVAGRSAAKATANAAAGTTVTINPTTGITPALITVTIDTAGLQPSTTYDAALTVTSLSHTITHDLVVKILAPNPRLVLSPPVLEVDLQAGTMSSAKFLVENSGGGATQDFSVILVDAKNMPWLTVTPSSGTVSGQVPAAVQVNVDATKLAPGPYFATLEVGLGALPTQVLPISINVIPPDPFIALDFNGVQFDVRKGQGLSVSQDVKILDTGGKPFTYTASIVSGSEWLQLATPTGTSNPTTFGVITLSTNPAFTNSPTNPTGLYFASIQVSSPEADNSPKLFTAILNLQDPNQVTATPLPNPTGLVFATSQGVDPTPQTVQIFTSSKTPVTFYASTQTYSGPDIDAGKPVNWLGLTATSGVASTGSPGSVDVTVTTAGLLPGVYTGGASFSIGSTVRTVNVSLVITAGAASSVTVRGDQASTAAAAATVCTPKKLVPTFAGGLVNNFSSQVAGPVPITVYVVDDCGNLIPDPTKTGSPKADVTIQFSAGDPSAKTMPLTDKKHAGYTITWVPDASADMTQVTVQAKLGSLSGAAQSTGTQKDAAAPADAQPVILSGTSAVFGQVLSGTAPVLLPNATLNNLNPQQGGALAPGTVVAIFGTNLTTGSPTVFHSVPLPTNLNGTSVTIGGLAAPLYYVSKNQIDAQVPFELDPGRQYEIVVNVNDSFTVPDHISLVDGAPGLAATASGQVLAEHANGSLITASSPALPNETIVLFLVGMGRVTPEVASGAPAPLDHLTQVITTPVVTIDGTAVVSKDVKFAGLAPGFVGLYQINFVVPADTKPGVHQVAVSQTSYSSNVATLPVGSR